MISIVRDSKLKIMVIGVGGAGNSIVKRMSEAKIKDVEYFLVNTDERAIQAASADYRLAIGSSHTGGRGTGGNAEIGRKSALEAENEIVNIIRGYDMIIIASGMGGGCGTGGAGVIAEIAKKMNILTLTFATLPFAFEGRRRMKNALSGLESLNEFSDALVIIFNEKLLVTGDEALSFVDAFRMVDDTLKNVIRSFTDILTSNGLINLDYADFKTILQGSGKAHISIGFGYEGDNGSTAISEALDSKLSDTLIRGAKGVIINIIGGSKLSLGVIHEITSTIHKEVGTDAEIIFGITIDEELEDRIQIILIAAGLNEEGSMKTVKQSDDMRSSKFGKSVPAKEDKRGMEVPSILTAMNRM